MTRIIGGRYKGRALAVPPGRTTRPTAARTREALFNILAHQDWGRLKDARVLDLFAGSGALGFEALSRGAAFCLFVDNDAAARGAMRETIEALGLFGQTRLHRRDATALGRRPAALGAPFDLVFLDPPYEQGLGEAALDGLRKGGWLSPDALAVYECAAAETPDLPDWSLLDERRYGAAKLLFLKPRQGPGSGPLG